MTITLQVSQHRHVLIGTYQEGTHACPASKYVMITAVTRWKGRDFHQFNPFVFASAQHHINQSRQTRTNKHEFSLWDGRELAGDVGTVGQMEIGTDGVWK